MKIGVLSDTHRYINPAIYGHLTNSDLILHAGDIGSFNVINELKQISTDVVSVRGNNDTKAQWQNNELDGLQKIPHEIEIKLPGGEIALTHGDQYYSDTLWHKHLRENFPNVKAIIYGHSHKLVCDQSQQPWILNPGPAGETRIKRNGASCLVIHVNKDNWDIEPFKA